MERIIYVDSLFVINFCIDFLALKASATMCATKCNTHRLLLGSFVGAFYSIATAYFDIKGVVALFCGLLMPFFMCFVAFDFYGVKNLLRISVTFLSVNIVFGGAVGAIENLLYTGKNPGLKSIIAWTSLCTVAIIKFSKALKEQTVKKQVNCSITLCGQQKNLTLLCDSGNVLKDPFTGKNVIIISAKCFGEMANAINEGRLESLYKAGPRIIPINTAGGKSLLYGFKPENIIINSDYTHEKPGAPLEIDATVALDLVNENFDGADGIIPPSLVI